MGKQRYSFIKFLIYAADAVIISDTMHIAPAPNITWPDIPVCDRTICSCSTKFSQHILLEKFCILPHGVLVSNAWMYGSNASNRLLKNVGNDVPSSKCIAVSCSHLTWHQFLQTYCSYHTSTISCFSVHRFDLPNKNIPLEGRLPIFNFTGPYHLTGRVLNHVMYGQGHFHVEFCKSSCPNK
jgi:hypothetical protein